MLEIKSDYVSLVFVYDDEFLNSNVMEYESIKEQEYLLLVSKVIGIIDNALSLNLLCGELENTYKGAKGYDMKYEFGNSGITISYSSSRPDMGVLLQMSGVALHKYRALYFQQFHQVIEVNHILRMLRDLADEEIGFFRLSRLDAAVDFINEDVDLTGFYSDLENDVIQIFNYKGHLNMSQFKSYQSGKEVQTVYIGSRQSNNMLRIYNKKDQVIEQNITTDLEKAINCKDWFRFEMEIKNKSAHVLTEILLEIETLDEYQSYLVQLMTDKYRFGQRKDNSYTFIEITERMLSAIDYQGVNIEIPRLNRNYDLYKSEMYFEVGDSGLQSLIYKQRLLFGREYVEEWFKAILEYNEKRYRPSEETSRYVRKVQEERKRNKVNLNE